MGRHCLPVGRSHGASLRELPPRGGCSTADEAVRNGIVRKSGICFRSANRAGPRRETLPGTGQRTITEGLSAACWVTSQPISPHGRTRHSQLRLLGHLAWYPATSRDSSPTLRRSFPATLAARGGRRRVLLPTPHADQPPSVRALAVLTLSHAFGSLAGLFAMLIRDERCCSKKGLCSPSPVAWSHWPEFASPVVPPPYNGEPLQAPGQPCS